MSDALPPCVECGGPAGAVCETCHKPVCYATQETACFRHAHGKPPKTRKAKK